MANESSSHKDPHNIHQQAPFSEAWLEPCLKAKHEIFLSHSRGQKNFTEQLCEDLKRVGYCPFFDKEPESLPKGEKFPPLLFQAVRECHVAILVLSEEFFSCSEWPMIELSEFVRVQESVNSRLKILPLFLGLNVKQVKDANNHKRWQRIWQGWADEEARRGVKEKRIDVKNWTKALSEVLEHTNGMEYNAGVGEVTYRKDVVAAVCRLVPQNANFDVSDVQALPRLCEAISNRLDAKVEPGCRTLGRTLGLFAMGGSGKSTISKAMCNVKFGEFAEKVCHVEFGGPGDTYMRLRQKVLKELTGFDPNHMPDDMNKLKSSLKDGMKRQMVFLVLDNVWEIDIEEAKMYLQVGFKEGSKVLVTSRSVDVLKSLSLKDSDCMEMPELKEEDATNLFLYHAARMCEHFSQEEEGKIKRCVEACKFAKRDVAGLGDVSNAFQYLPLALKVWGIQLGQISGDEWLASLERLSNHKFNHFDEQKHPLFSLMRQGYDALKPMNQEIFLDLALFFPRVYSHGPKEKYNVVEWLKMFYDCPKDRINCILLAMRRNALLEDFRGEDDLELRIHDLYLEFAREEVKAGRFDERRILYLEGSDIPKRPRIGSWSNVERLGLYKSKVKSLIEGKLHLCPNVEMLQVYGCSELVEADVEGFECLKSLDIFGCHGLGTKFVGVEKLGNPVWFRWRNIQQFAPILQNFSSLTALQVLHLSLSRDYSFKENLPIIHDPPTLSGCINLRELTMDSFTHLRHFPDLGNLFKLQKLILNLCYSAKSVCGLSFPKTLKLLNLRACFVLEELPGLWDLVALETLDLSGMRSLSKIDGLEKLQHLRDLIVSSCFELSSLEGLEYLTSLQRLDASGCLKLKEIPDCSHLHQVENVNLSWSGVCVVLGDFGRLANRSILDLDGCKGLIEPVLYWWMCQLSEICETTDGWIAPGFLFPEQSCLQLKRVISGFVAYYLNQAMWLITEKKFISLGNSFTGPNSELLEVMGVHMVIETLCYTKKMDILSLFVAKFAATGKYWALLTDESMTHITLSDDMPYHIQTSRVLILSYRIVDFLAHQIREMLMFGFLLHRNMWRVQFILQHMTKNEMMATALGRNICHFIRLCLNHPSLRQRVDDEDDEDHEVHVRSRYFEEALERCKLGETC